MKIELRLGGLITVNGREIALGRTFALLDAIARERSVRGAADRLSLSYRSAWGRVIALEEAIGRAVVVKTKGHGTVLTELGEELRQSLGKTRQRFETSLAKEQRALEARLTVLVSGRPRKLKVAASHDPLLMDVLGARFDVEVAVMGSEAALERLFAGQADVAGCHFGPQATHGLPTILRDRDYVAHAAFKREQGLIVARGNPLGLHSIADLARTGARFINRQRGSGTRAWFDRMLEAEAIPPSAIVGYSLEEFTHHAVAAVVASGAADAGFGVRAAAESFETDFVPLGAETYYLVRRSDFGSPILEEIVRALRRRSRTDLVQTSRRAGQTPDREKPFAEGSAGAQRQRTGTSTARKSDRG